jgi:hypothetical protein
MFCPSDNALLCAACDLHVHTGNALAARHHRLPLDKLQGLSHLDGNLAAVYNAATHRPYEARVLLHALSSEHAAAVRPELCSN